MNKQIEADRLRKGSFIVWVAGCNRTGSGRDEKLEIADQCRIGDSGIQTVR